MEEDRYIIQFEEEDDENTELLRQAYVLMSVRKGSIPIDRDFGINMDILSEPVSDLETDLMTELLEQFEKYIPELKVVSVEISDLDDQGMIKPVITLERNTSYGG